MICYKNRKTLFVLRKSVIFQMRYKKRLPPDFIRGKKMLLSKIFTYRIKTLHFFLTRKPMADYFILRAIVLCI